tara:strand:+ start:1210 stop:2370 length:1161 start_codon:yes stop_codon:yes gene_type:complete
VGGSVRDLLVDRHPKDFDIGTSAHPHEIKKIFKNCWIIGRRFRLAHIKFGPKTIEVATFRRQQTSDDIPHAETERRNIPIAVKAVSLESETKKRPVIRDNNFGSAEEDAFRRDFTVNGLFYDVATLSVIDYVGGLTDLRNRLIRSIGDPNERFIEDPVRMVRAISFAARLDFRLDLPIRKAIERHKQEITKASPARMTEELYKILRSGVSTATYKLMLKLGLLECIAPELANGVSKQMWKSLQALDKFRNRFRSCPSSLTNAILLGSLLNPVKQIDLRPKKQRDEREAGVSIGQLPVAKKDVERLRQLLLLQPRLLKSELPSRVQKRLMHRSAFQEALSWMTIHTKAKDALDRWETLVAKHGIPTKKKIVRRRRKRPRNKILEITS